MHNNVSLLIASSIFQTTDRWHDMAYMHVPNVCCKHLQDNERSMIPHAETMADSTVLSLTLCSFRTQQKAFEQSLLCKLTVWLTLRPAAHRTRDLFVKAHVRLVGISLHWELSLHLFSIPSSLQRPAPCPKAVNRHHKVSKTHIRESGY